ncbi:efflux RND transporter periplasmic adaptor subunit [Desulfovibrio mangrovi]|uniref:HlyD family secretion protein n=1 Tax=Desulfovibrio mangrovi TaxID=2976983 RepID=UPI00224855CA|nr:efflux RND transporter periplasmic adaptor subunit [Desulfovibrio mangrovi]UZP67537.1 efflux RND transporter periplasmic adaptor subunit [Desulfovibrio mangrovi]
MKALVIILLSLFAAGAGYVYLDRHMAAASEVKLPVTPAAQHIAVADNSFIVASGVVEPVSEELELSFELSGLIEEVLVSEGESVKAGQLLARLKQDSYLAKVENARAENSISETEYRKQISGGRQQERNEAWAAVKQAKMIMEQNLREAKSRDALQKNDHIATEEVYRAWKEYYVAKEAHKEAQARFELADRPFRSEDIKKAAFSVNASKARLHEAEAELAKTRLTAPIAGTVLRLLRQGGEAVSILFDSPVIALGDISTLNIRAEVDEKDIGHLRVGLPAYATATAFGEQRFPGRITRISQIMGRKKIFSGDPAETMDRKVLEIIVTLDAPGPLVSGLRMDVFISATP